MIRIAALVFCQLVRSLLLYFIVYYKVEMIDYFLGLTHSLGDILSSTPYLIAFR